MHERQNSERKILINQSASHDPPTLLFEETALNYAVGCVADSKICISIVTADIYCVC